MSDLWITYRDVEAYPRKQFEIMDPPPEAAMLVKPGVLPGAFGYPDLHIAWHVADVHGVTIHLCTYTEQAVSQKEAGRLLLAAYRFAKERN